MKHTPGPWITSKFGFQVLTGDSWSVICELKPNPKWEDGRGVYKQENAWENQEANARLIAAAPELLAALKEIICLYEICQPGPMPSIKEIAEEAIAKAEGEVEE